MPGVTEASTTSLLFTARRKFVVVTLAVIIGRAPAGEVYADFFAASIWSANDEFKRLKVAYLYIQANRLLRSPQQLHSRTMPKHCQPYFPFLATQNE